MAMIRDTSQQLWRTAYDEQHTPETMHRLFRHVKGLIRFYRRYGLRSTDTAEDRVHDALAKLFAGSRTWDPSRVDLFGFLAGVVTSDLSTEIERSKVARMVSLDRRAGAREDDYTGEVIEDSASSYATRLMDGGRPVPLACESKDAAWELALTHLRDRACAHGDVLAMLDSYDEGIIEKQAVMKHLRWTAYKYRRAYEQLVRLATDADPDVREAIRAGLSN